MCLYIYEHIVIQIKKYYRYSRLKVVTESIIGTTKNNTNIFCGRLSVCTQLH